MEEVIITDLPKGFDCNDWLNKYDMAVYDDRIEDTLQTEKQAMSLLQFIQNATPTLGDIQKARQIIVQALRNPSTPWIQNGIQIRGAFLFGSGFYFDNADKELSVIRQNPRCKDILSYSWLERLNQELLVAGNVFLVHNKKTNLYFMLDLNQIQSIVVDADDNSFITHIERSTNGIGGQLQNYYIQRADIGITRTERSQLPNNAKINDNYEFWHFSTTKNASEPLAVPLLLETVLYAQAAARYLIDTSRFKHAVSIFAGKVKSQTKDGAAKALDTIQATDKAGAFAGMTDIQLSAMSANGLNISTSGSIEFLAPVASALTIPVSALSMSVMGSGGTAGSLTTLDLPMLNYYKSQRNILKYNIENLLGGNAKINFLPISKEELELEIKQISIGYEDGAIDVNEYRDYLNNVYDKGLNGAPPKFEDSFKGRPMIAQAQINKDLQNSEPKAITQEIPIIEDPEDPAKEGGETEERQDDTGQPKKGKRVKQKK
ncbi:MAG: hypothetical protein LBT91_02675 [Bifidobacteriaceae bacterium]|jgi:hypothetical protein|nr:hypothetical protein [Bifidobacteriaceae bacterium]